MAIGASDEEYVPSRTASARPEFLRLGLADAALLDLAAMGVTIVTADLDLSVAVRSKGHPSLDFHHLREDDLT